MTGQQSSATPWASAPGTPAFRAVSRRRAAIWALTFVAGLIAGFASSRILVDSSPIGTSNGPSTAAATVATEPDAYLAYRQTLANLDAAVERHDTASMARFRQALADQSTSTVMTAIHEDYARLLANIAAAEDRHDAHMLAVLRSQLSDLCPAVDAGFSLSFCH